MMSCVVCGLSDSIVPSQADDPEWKACRCGHLYRHQSVPSTTSRYRPINALERILRDKSVLDDSLQLDDDACFLWPVPPGVLSHRATFRLVDVDDRQAKAFLSDYVLPSDSIHQLVVIGSLDIDPTRVVEKIQRLKPNRIQLIFRFVEDRRHEFNRNTAIQFVDNNLDYEIKSFRHVDGGPIVLVAKKISDPIESRLVRPRFSAHSSSVVHYYHDAAFSNRRQVLSDYKTVYLLFSGPTINQWTGPSESDRTSYQIFGCKGVIGHERWGSQLDGYFCGDAVFNRQRMVEPIPFENLKADCDVYCASTERGRWLPEHGVNDRNVNVLRDSLYPRRVFLIDFTHEDPYELTTDGRGALIGHNTGLLMYQAAVLLGARRIVFVGADCTRSGGDQNVHFDDAPSSRSTVRDDYLKHWRALHRWNLTHFPECKGYVMNPVGLVGLWDATQ